MTRTLAITQNITLDGRIEMLGDWFDEQGTSTDVDDVIEQNRLHREASDALLVGRDTFVSFRGYWRDLADDRTGVSDHLNSVDKYVVTSTLTDADLDWPGSSVVALDEVADLKAQAGMDIVCTGSITLAHALAEAGLVDEYRLFTYPVVQGRGRRLFPEGLRVQRLRLVEVRGFRSGITLSTYAAH